MADRTSASIFAIVFKCLAEDNSEKAREFARKLWGEKNSYDFNSYQMYCDEALITLGLAKKGINPEYPEDGEVTLYWQEDYT